MSVRPIIDIEINDAEFQRFYARFQEYAAELDEMPEAWRALGEAMGDSSKGLTTGAVSAKEALALAAAQAGIIGEALRDAVSAQKNLGRETHSSTKGMQNLQKSAQGVGKAISFIGSWIVRLGAIGGLGALFGGFGIGELASAAFSRTRQAGQLGISPGQLASFQVNAQQFLTTSSLEAAANAQNDITKVGPLSALGISYTQEQRLSNVDLAFEELRKAAEAYRRNPAIFAQTKEGQAYLGALGGNLGEVRFAATHLAGLDAAQAATNRDAGILGFSDATGQAWTKLKITLDKAGVSIQSALIDRLAPLAPQIAKLADDIANFIRTFINGPAFDTAVKDTENALKGLISFLHTTDWKALGAEIGSIIDKFRWLIPDSHGHSQLPANPFNKKDWENTYGAKATAWLFKTIVGDAKGFGTFLKDAALTAGTFSYGASGIGKPVNNPLDMKIISGGKTDFAQFDSTDAGIRGNAKRLAQYPELFGADTLAKIIKVWAPSDDGNNPEDYTSNVERWSGVNRNLSMSKWTKAQFAAVFAAMSREEGTDRVSIGQVVKALYGNDLQAMKAHHQAQHAQQHAKGHRVKTTQKAPVHVSITNATSARVAVAINAVSVS